MLRLDFRYLRFFAFSIFLISVRALGQFEVAPDHFDSSTTNAVHQRTAKRGSRTVHSATAQPMIHQDAAAATRSKRAVHQSKHNVRRPRSAPAQTATAVARR
jgi:hypothetical protein